MSLHRQFGTNPQKTTEGVEIKYDANPDGSIPTFTIKRMSSSNTAYQRVVEVKMKPHTRKINAGTMEPGALAKMWREIFVYGALVSWANIQNADGSSVGGEKKDILAFLDGLPDLGEDLQEKARDITTFQDTENEEDAGN